LIVKKAEPTKLEEEIKRYGVIDAIQLNVDKGMWYDPVSRGKLTWSYSTSRSLPF
jgi:hypothetical protein